MTPLGLNVHWKQSVCCDATKLDCSLFDNIIFLFVYIGLKCYPKKIPLTDVQFGLKYESSNSSCQTL